MLIRKMQLIVNADKEDKLRDNIEKEGATYR